MKKRVYFILLSLLILCSFFISAETLNSTESKAYACLEQKVNNRCSNLSTEEKIFSFLAINKCKTELLTDQSSTGCFPSSNCNIKTTAQSILALKIAGESTLKPEEWLLSKSIPSPNVEWFLQIEPTGKSSCTISYTSRSYSIVVDEEKKISRGAGSCLSVYDNYWLKIAPSCYNQNFEISCNSSFMTSLIYRKKSLQSIHDFYIPDRVNSASSGGTTTEKVKSSCFSTRTSCDYEGTLWATLILDYLGKDISEYLPYLMTMMEDNFNSLPESFLYTVTGDFEVDLLAKQRENKFWLESGDKFYDTAVALFPFQNDNLLTEKANSKDWLGDVQGNDGCWQGNIRNTAFLLYSLWARERVTPATPTNITNTTTPATLSDCEDSGNFCISSYSCLDSDGETLSNYSGCLGTNICCSENEILRSCEEKEGELCESEESCLNDGVEVESSDSTANSICCVRGECGIPEEPQEENNECETNGGACKYLCNSETETTTSDTCSPSEICCIYKTKSSGFGWVILILVIFIGLTVAGIIFKDKIRVFLFRFKPKSGGKSSPTTGGPRFPPSSSSNVYPGSVPRRIVPYSQPQAKYPIQRKTEVDDVLKKLKGISE